jgi:hypothetical protein
MSQGTNPPTVSPDKVVQRLCSSELGLALWRAAVAEETVELYRERVDQLEGQQAPQRE